MNILLRYTFLILSLAVLVGCGDDGIIEKENPIIKGQSVVSGDVDVSIEPQTILILFDRKVELNDPSRVAFSPSVPFDIKVDSIFLTIQTLEKMEYNMEYQLHIGEGVVVDEKTKGANFERTIVFHTEEGPYVPPAEIAIELVTENALPVAQELYTFMWGIYGHGVLSGAMTTQAWDLYECEWVNSYTGVYPAVANFNYQYLHRSPSTVLNYANIEIVEKWWNDGGIVAIDWHWMIPQAEGSNRYSYLKEDTTATLENMLTEGTWENDVLKADLEDVADMLLLLQERGIPVLWRPIPESQSPRVGMVGGSEYYWWSGESAKNYKALWHKIFDYFEERGLRNLIWVWTSQVYDIRFYPGDEYVDIVALDLYNKPIVNDVASLWDTINEDFPHRMVSLGETGGIPAIGSQLDSNIHWGYFVTHSDRYNDFTESFTHTYATMEWWKETISDERVLTRSSLSRMKSYQAVRALK